MIVESIETTGFGNFGGVVMVERIARELRESGMYDAFTTGAMTYAEANALVS